MYWRVIACLSADRRGRFLQGFSLTPCLPTGREPVRSMGSLFIAHSPRQSKGIQARLPRRVFSLLAMTVNAWSYYAGSNTTPCLAKIIK
ncbi:MAG: hypothetical protein ACI9CF_001274 [Candidatus Omnitrophota bacterium]|jgi:hypothetical protein